MIPGFNTHIEIPGAIINNNEITPGSSIMSNGVTVNGFKYKGAVFSREEIATPPPCNVVYFPGDATSRHLDLSTAESQRMGQEVTIQMWFKPEDITKGRLVDESGNFTVRLENTLKVNYLTWSAEVDTGSTPILNEWNFLYIAISVRDYTITLNEDTVTGTAGGSGLPVPRKPTIRFGCTSSCSASDKYIGYMGDIQLYNKVTPINKYGYQKNAIAYGKPYCIDPMQSSLECPVDLDSYPDGGEISINFNQSMKMYYVYFRLHLYDYNSSTPILKATNSDGDPTWEVNVTSSNKWEIKYYHRDSNGTTEYTSDVNNSESINDSRGKWKNFRLGFISKYSGTGFMAELRLHDLDHIDPSTQEPDPLYLAGISEYHLNASTDLPSREINILFPNYIHDLVIAQFMSSPSARTEWEDDYRSGDILLTNYVLAAWKITNGDGSNLGGELSPPASDAELGSTIFTPKSDMSFYNVISQETSLYEQPTAVQYFRTFRDILSKGKVWTNYMINDANNPEAWTPRVDGVLVSGSETDVVPHAMTHKSVKREFRPARALEMLDVSSGMPVTVPAGGISIAKTEANEPNITHYLQGGCVLEFDHRIKTDFLIITGLSDYRFEHIDKTLTVYSKDLGVKEVTLSGLKDEYDNILPDVIAEMRFSAYTTMFTKDGYTYQVKSSDNDTFEDKISREIRNDTEGRL